MPTQANRDKAVHFICEQLGKPQHGAIIGEEPGRNNFIVSTWGNSDTNPLENPVYGTISSENLFSGTVIFQSLL